MSDANLHPVMQAALAPHMPAKRQPRIGDLQVSPYSEYQPGGLGFVVEQFHHSAGWCLPAWDERGLPQLGDVFETRAAAERALREAF